MSTLQPISYGPEVQADTRGVSSLEQATAQHDTQLTGAEQYAADAVTKTSSTIAQGILHSQALKATADNMKSTADTLNYIQTHPTVQKEDLLGIVGPASTDKILGTLKPSDYDSDTGAIPMYRIAGQVFSERGQQARQDSGAQISLPGWRQSWDQAAQTEESQKLEHVNQIAGHQLIDDQQQKVKNFVVQTMNSASSLKDFDVAANGVSGTTWFSPDEKQALIANIRTQRDSWVANRAMAMPPAQGLQPMKDELTRLQSNVSEKLYPGLDEKQKLTLTTELTNRIKLAQSSLEADDSLSKQFQIAQNREIRGKVIELMAKGTPPSMMSGILNQRFFSPNDMTSPNPSLTRGFYPVDDTQKEVYELLTQYAKSQAEGKTTDNYGKRGAMEMAYRNDPTGFTKAVLTGGGKFTVPGTESYKNSDGSYGITVDMANDFTPSTATKFFEYAHGWDDPKDLRAKQEQANSVHQGQEDDNIVDQLGKLDPSLMDKTPDALGRRAQVKDAMDRAVEAAELEPGSRKQSADQRRDTRVRAAQLYVKQAQKSGWHMPWNEGSPQIGTLQVKAPDGRTMDIDPAEKDAMVLGAQRSGLHVTHAVDPKFFNDSVVDYNQNFKSVIDDKFSKLTGPDSTMTQADSYSVYFNAKKYMREDSILAAKVKSLPPDSQVGYIVTKTLQRMAVEEQARKSGGN